MTETVVAALADDGRCQRFVSGSAIGYYGPTGDHAVDESAPAGDDFLANVVVAWRRPLAAPVPTVFVRTGHVMTPRGGYIGAQLLPFKLGSGARSATAATGQLDIPRRRGGGDPLAAHQRGHGCVQPHRSAPRDERPLDQSDGRRAAPSDRDPVPRTCRGALFGSDFVEEAMLSSQWVLPNRLEDAGFEFRDNEIEAAWPDCCRTSDDGSGGCHRTRASPGPRPARPGRPGGRCMRIVPRR